MSSLFALNFLKIRWKIVHFCLYFCLYVTCVVRGFIKRPHLHTEALPSLLCHAFVSLSSCLHVQMKLMKLLQRLPASVVRRLHRERYRKPSWLTPIPESHKLTEDDITEFVKSMMQPVLLAMFSKTGSLDAAQALQNLALMRPELVIPPVLEK